MLEQRFDVIIVGGGTAGCVIASRLSTITHLRILLLEAGADRNDDPKALTPLSSRRMFKDPNYDWGYETEPQIGLENRIIQHTRGRMLGGSSAINSHSIVFPNRDMHDTWARMIGDEKWSWEQMKNCYTRFHDVVGASESSNSTSPEKTESIKVSYPQEPNQLQKAWEEVFTDLNMKSKSDGPSGCCFGGFTTTNAIDSRPGKGERSHAGTAYLQPVIERDNLVVESNTRVERVFFKRESGILTATGVIYEKDGQKLSAKANREVIISAGVFGSPQLLELSGIGRKEVLEDAGIECLFDLRGVGENLQDHLNFGPSVEIIPGIETLDDAARDPTIMASWQEQYLKSRSGPLAEGAAYSFAFWPLQLFNTTSEEEGLRSLLALHSSQNDISSRSQHEDFIKRMILSPDEASATVFMVRRQRYTSAGNEADGNYISIIAMLAHPFSCGSTHIKTADPENHPKIDCNYLSHPLDAEILSRHCLQIEHLLEQPVYREIVKPNGQWLPQGYESPSKSLEEIKSAIRQHGATNYHPCGTCAMTDFADGGVVDGNLRVYGTSNLRICDASVFPIIPRGNILTTVYAVAEKAAEMLLQEYSSTESKLVP